MSQTDRQTDKAIHWSITAFNEVEIIALSSNSTYPVFVKRVYGGLEKCKTSGREHYQAHVQLWSQQRMSALKKWLPTAHLEISRDWRASIYYAMKKDTSTGEKKVLDSLLPHVDNQEALLMLARTCPDMCEHTFYDPKYTGPKDDAKRIPVCTDDNQHFWHRVNIILERQPMLVGLFTKPDIQRAWKWTKGTWFQLAKEEGQIVLPAPPQEGEEFEFGTNEIISQDTVHVTNLQEEGTGQEESSQEGSSEEGDA